VRDREGERERGAGAGRGRSNLREIGKYRVSSCVVSVTMASARQRESDRYRAQEATRLSRSP